MSYAASPSSRWTKSRAPVTAARIRAWWPRCTPSNLPIATTLRTGIAIFTYCGTVTFGITGDFAANPDLDVLARGIEHDLSELLAAARRHQRTSVTS